MWKQVLQVAARFWKLAEETRRNSTEIRELRHEMNEMGKVLDRVLYELQRQKENEAHERENLILRLENDCSDSSAACRRPAASDRHELHEFRTKPHLVARASELSCLRSPSF